MDQPFFHTTEELTHFIESATENNSDFRTKVIDPIIAVFEKSKGKNRYIQLGTEFIDANAEMLSKPYPTTPVSYPRKYVDEIFELFGYDKTQFRKLIKDMASELNGTSGFNTLLNSLTSVFHTVALFYSDMTMDRKLRDSARQQIGLTTYGHIYRRYWPQGFLDEQVMEYTHSQLNRTWDLVKSESVVNWIYHFIEVSYGKFRSEMTVDMSIKVMIDFIQRCWTTVNQSMKKISNRYYVNIDDAKRIGSDVKGNEDYLKSNSHAQIRDNLVRMIVQGDNLYKEKGELYKGTARSKNVKTEELYSFAQRVDKKDIKLIIDLILYVFLVKEEHKIDEINSTEYIRRINQFPTAIDRAIPGKPVILTLKEKYNEKEMIVKSYICLLATYIILRINDAKPD